MISGTPLQFVIIINQSSKNTESCTKTAGPLITLDVPVYPSDKKIRTQKADCSAKHAQAKTEHHRVPKVKARLEET